MEIIAKNEDIYQGLLNNVLLNYDLSKEEDIEIQGKDNYYFHITNSKNDLDVLNGNINKTNKFSVIDLGECEDLLKDHYHINKNDSLLIMKLEKIINISSERSLQYEIYNPYNKEKLNLSICSNITIDVYTPVILSEKLQILYEELKDMGYDLFDINSRFYQDICTPYKSNEGTDVLLTDRINYYYNNNETVCQSNCKFSDYLMDSQYLKCDCKIMNSEINIQETSKFNPKLIYNSFYNILKNSNYKVLNCYKLALSINSVTKNIGSIITIINFLIFIIFLICYIVKGKNQLNLNIKKVFKKNLEENDSRKKHLLENCIRKTVGKEDKIKIKSKGNINYNKIKSKKRTKMKIQRISKKLTPEKFINKMKIKYDNMKILDYYELNNLDYLQAKKLDKRSYFQIYWSLLKREHPFIFTFITKDDYNITIIKYSRFIFLLCTDMAMNVFFFSDETMHKMFLDYGKYNFIQQIPQIIYSTIISKLLEILLCFLSMTDKYFYQLKKNNNLCKNLFFQIKKRIKIKILFFFIFTIFMFLFYWYLITCFCAVYQNTQIAFIKDSLLSFLLDNLIPFIIYLFPTLFRIISLKLNIYCSKCLYQFSSILPFF